MRELRSNLRPSLVCQMVLALSEAAVPTAVHRELIFAMSATGFLSQRGRMLSYHSVRLPGRTVACRSPRLNLELRGSSALRSNPRKLRRPSAGVRPSAQNERKSVSYATGRGTPHRAFSNDGYFCCTFLSAACFNASAVHGGTIPFSRA